MDSAYEWILAGRVLAATGWAMICLIIMWMLETTWQNNQWIRDFAAEEAEHAKRLTEIERELGERRAEYRARIAELEYALAHEKRLTMLYDERFRPAADAGGLSKPDVPYPSKEEQ